jgi:hypothetical protein
VNTYLILYTAGLSEEVEADFYEGRDGDYVFIARQEEVLRVSAASVASISKAR